MIAGGLWLHRRKPQQPVRAPAAAPALVLPSQITLNGKVRAAHITPVTTQVPGTIDAFEANVGDEVSQGQVLARIGSSGLESSRADAVAAVEKAQNRVEESEKAVTSAQLEASRAHADAERSRLALDRANKVFDRQKTLLQAGATPRLTYEKAASDYQSAAEEWDAVDKAQRAAASRVQDTLKQLDNAKRLLAARNAELEDAQNAVAAGVVESPVDGLVVARQGELGQPVAELGGELFQIATDLYDLEVVVEPSPEIRKRMRPHEPALVIIPDLQNTGYPGEVKQFVDKQVVIGFTSPTPAIRPGMVAEVRLRPE
jgi:multidrug efflux pump subunit AcrA (membrane-fusion protein)